jgi:hypothetical protein
MLCSALHPTVEPKDKRYLWTPDESDPRLMRYEVESADQGSDYLAAEERRGVHHLVQGWIQQGQPKKVI